MVTARTWSVALAGVEGHVVEVEADLTPGLPAFTLVGLPDAALSEARDRVRAAVVNSGESWPAHRITVNLSPASLHKRGSAFDLALACAVLSSAGAVPPRRLADAVLFGELGLDGRVRAVRGVLPAVLAAAAAGRDRVVVAEANAAEAALVPGVSVLGVRSLRQLVALLRGQPEPDEPVGPSPVSPAGDHHPPHSAPDDVDLADVCGQFEARTALEVAAAGGHHLFLHGVPGAGKTMLAERLPGVLPPLDRDAALEVTAVHSVAGTLPAGRPFLDRPPFCGPHHTASMAAMVGGGSGVARPGAVSLAHRGVLFLDEAPEFGRGVLDALRQPLESGQVVIARANGSARFPARFALVLAANPCPCGLGTGKGDLCSCTPQARRRYIGRLSGPLLDRIDMTVDVRAVGRVELLADLGLAEPSAVVAERVLAARERSARRLRATPWRTNAEVPGRVLRSTWRLSPRALRPAEAEMDIGRLTARGLDRVVRVAWTVADLAGVDVPGVDEVQLALAFRIGTTLAGAA